LLYRGSGIRGQRQDLAVVPGFRPVESQSAIPQIANLRCPRTAPSNTPAGEDNLTPAAISGLIPPGLPHEPPDDMSRVLQPIREIVPGKKSWRPPAALLTAALALSANASRPQISVVPQWGRFEVTLRSSVNYAHPLSDATLTATFVSPHGETNRVFGFWDGGHTWRVRFSPDAPGHWTFTTTCSDRRNAGLERQTGAFLCTAAMNKTALDRHGPVRVARDRRHFEHADGRPFLWLGDAVRDGARRSTLSDWQLYAGIRAQQKFTVAQWTVAPGTDARGETAFARTNGFGINPGFFQRLDAKVEALNAAGLVSAIVPLQEFGPAGEALTEEQATLFVRYVVARWGAERVAWLLAFEGDSLGRKVDRWKRIGRRVFGDATRGRAPVILLPGETHWLLDEFRNETWLDAFGLARMPPGDDALQWLLTGPLSVEWRKDPPRPLLNLSPPAEQAAHGDDARHLLWWSALMHPTAGASYAAAPVLNWVTNATTNPDIRPRDLPQWREALFLPGAKSVAPLADFFTAMEFWRLRPAQNVLIAQPGLVSPRRHIAAAATEARNWLVIYVPEDRTLELPLSALPPAAAISWLNARTGARSTAVGLIGGNTCQFPTPEPGDWLLVIRQRK
jgi:hypothetical protein